MRRLFSLLLLHAILLAPLLRAGPAAAGSALAIPPGWRDAAPPARSMFVSPKDASGREVLMLIGSATAGTRATPAWLATLAGTIGDAFGRTTWRQGATIEDETLLKDALTVTGDRGQTLHVLLFGYDTPAGAQPFALVFPKPVKIDDARVEAALDAIAANWRAEAAAGALSRPSSEPAAEDRPTAEAPAPPRTTDARSPRRERHWNCRTIEREVLVTNMQMICSATSGCTRMPVQSKQLQQQDVCE